MAQPEDLGSQRLGGNREVAGLPGLPVLPVITAAPSRKHHDSHLVREIEKLFAFQLSLQLFLAALLQILYLVCYY